MILIGRTRGNGLALAKYLMNSPANDNAECFDIRGSLHKDNVFLALREFSLKGELTKSKKEIFHLVMNPPQEATMSAEDWLTCTKIVEKHMMPFADQPRVMVLHHKRHIHMHVAYSRVDANGKIIPDKFFNLALSKARREIEEALGQKRTPFRNRNRDEIKKTLTKLWQQTTTGQEFIKAALQQGYTIVRSESRRHFMVVDENGRSFDLVRQLKGIRTKQVRERLQGCKLELDKTVIRNIRIKLDAQYFDRLQENSLTVILEQKKKYDERQEELLAFREKAQAMKQTGQEIMQDSNPLTASQKKAAKMLETYKKRQLLKQQKQSFTGKPNSKLEKALQDLKLAMEEADERQKKKVKTMDE